ncbi:MAG: c-type cytochrome [Polyangiaceae bacterium]|jgi:cytochrome c oxidase cbb3-type subunit 3
MSADDKHSNSNGSGAVHVYDDIVEHDNKLPLWWQLTLYGAVVFAFVYWFGRRLDAIASPAQTYQAAAAAQRAADAERARLSPITDDMLVTLARDSSTVAQGKDLFATTCAPCHRADGGGNIGPNLTDAYWIHGGKPTDIFRTAFDGVQAKGMPTWGPQLGERRIQNVVAYVLSIKNTNVPGGKAPQGDPEP